MASFTRPAGRTQRERLLDAMIAVCAQAGYADAGVARVSAAAGVSTATFYEHYRSREDCLLEACRTAAGRLFEDQPQPRARGGADPLRLALEALFAALQRDGDAARLLFGEARAGGPRARAERQRLLGDYERTLEALLHGPSCARTLDLPAAALLGAIGALVCARLREQGAPQLDGLLDDLWRWAGSYALPRDAPRFSVGAGTLLACAPSPPAEVAACSRGLRPRQHARGRHRLPALVSGHIQRTRIANATAQLAFTKGYAQITVSDVVAAAGTGRQIFYRHFPSKREAFIAAQQHGNVALLRACADAYFAGDGWPARVWSALDVLTALAAAKPALGYARIVEGYAAGPLAADHVEQLRGAASIFLQEGFGFRAQARKLPSLCADAVAGALLELFQRDLATGEAAMLPRRLPLLTYIAIAPFAGPRTAARLVSELSAQARPA